MRRWACLDLRARVLRARRFTTILAFACAVLAFVAALWPPGLAVSAAPAASGRAADSENVQTVAAACGARPYFRVSTLLQLDGRQLASVTALSGATLTSLNFGTTRPLQNAFVDFGTQTGLSGTFSIPLPPGSTATSFSVRTATAGATPVTVPFVVNTSCGSAPTLVGGGSSVPFGGSVKGTVFNACNNQPVANATVQVKGGNTSATTDANGRYELFGPVGTHTVEIIAAGFPTNTGQVSMTRGGTVGLPLPIDGPTGTVTGQVLRASPTPVVPVYPVWVNLSGTTTRVSAIGPDARYTMPNVPRGQQKLTVIESGPWADFGPMIHAIGPSAIARDWAPRLGALRLVLGRIVFA